MLLIYKTNLICLKQLSEAGPGLLLFAACRSGRLHCGQIFSLFFSSYQPYLSDLHKQRGWVESDSVWYLSLDQTFSNVSVRQTGLGLGLFASKRKPEYSHPLNKVLSVLVVRIKCFEIGYRKHFPQKKMHTFAFTKSWICLFGICVLFLNTLSIKESPAMKIMMDLTSCLPTAPKVCGVHQLFIGGRCEKQWEWALRVASIMIASPQPFCPGTGGTAHRAAVLCNKMHQFEQNKTKVQCNQMHQFEQNAMLLKFTLVPPCFTISRDYCN